MTTEQITTRTYKVWVSQDEFALREMAANGIPAKAIAETLGRTYSSINNRAKELGIRMAYPCGELHPGVQYPDHVIKAIIALRESGLTSVEIAHLLKKSWRISSSHVGKVCRGVFRKEGETA